MSDAIQLSHPRLGLCHLVAVEGTDWIVLSISTGKRYRVPSFRRSEFVCVKQPSPPQEFINQQSPITPSEKKANPSSSPLTSPQPGSPPLQHPTQSTPEISRDGALDRRRLRKIIESLRNGLPPTDATYDELQQLTVGFEDFGYRVANMLHKVEKDGGFTKVVRAVYGQGKSSSLLLLRGKALAEGFLVAQTEVDASENRLDRPSNIYRDLMRNLRFPDGVERGASGLALRVAQIVRPRVGVVAEGYQRNIIQIRDWFQEKIECKALAWLLCDPDLVQKEKLRSLLAGENIWRVTEFRNQHFLSGGAYDWPRFSASSQGGFACYLLSGIGRLSRVLGYKGLIVILDEMEEWQDLSWSQQTRAGNLIGGLIWGATERFPFTTTIRCHMGLIIAMTPRGAEGPEETWKQFGPMNIYDLPEFTVQSLKSYMPIVAKQYATAFELPEPNVSQVTQRALALWRARGDSTARSAVQSAIEALDAWRGSL